MNESHRATAKHDQPEWYEICVKGQLDSRWAERFDGLNFTYTSDGTTLLTGPVVDQAALHSLLRRVRDLGLTLVSVIQVDAEMSNRPDGSADSEENRSNKEPKL